MTVTFVGHSSFCSNDEVIQKLITTIEKFIIAGYSIFLCGGYGNFDNTVASILNKLKTKYPNIKLIYVTPYLENGENSRLRFITDMQLYDESLYPSIENVPLKFAIVKRNEWMIDQADVIIAYISFHCGGAYRAFQYAQRKKKTIINLADKLI